MGTIERHQQLILDAIDMLRQRKARPDAERIYNVLFRKHQISCQEARAALDRCVETGVVLRVAYKGQISYRNASKKFSHLKRDAITGAVIRPQPTKPRRKFTSLLNNAFAELVIQEPDYLEIGVPQQELIRNILSRENVKYTKHYVSILLEKEVDMGGLIRMGNGNFLVGPNSGATSAAKRKIEKGQNDRHQNLIIIDAHPNKLKKKGVHKLSYKKERYMESYKQEDKRYNESLSRVGRKKRAKKVFDPSDNNVPQRRRGRPLGSFKPRPPINMDGITNGSYTAKSSDADSRPESRASTGTGGGSGVLSINGRVDQSGVCSVCHIQNKKGPNDRMVSCRECSNKAHASCLSGDDMMLKMYPDNTWQCPHCKTCVICYETSDAGSLIVCSICADAYHLNCHQPKIFDRIKSGTRWLCTNCQMPEQLAIDDIQMGYNMDNAKVVTGTDEVQIRTSTQRKSPANRLGEDNNSSLPPSPTPPTLSPQTVLDGNEHDNGLNGTIASGTEERKASKSVKRIRTRSPFPTDGRLSSDDENLEDDDDLDEEDEDMIEDDNQLDDEDEDSKSDVKSFVAANNQQQNGTVPKSDFSQRIAAYFAQFDDIDLEENVDPNIPDASNWSPEEVYDYFVQYFPEEAYVFKDQEIDGHSLLLMRRMDVLKGLSLKLGPALKIYRHVLKLQYRRDDPKLYWA